MTALFAGRTLAFASAGYLYAWNPNAPYVLMAFCLSCAAVILFTRSEVAYQQKTNQKVLGLIKEALRAISHSGSAFRLVVLMVLGIGIADGIWILLQPRMREIGMLAESVGVIYACGAFVSAASAQFIKNPTGPNSERHIPTLFILLTICAALGLALSTGPVGVGISLGLVSIAFGFWWTCISSALNKCLESHYRATALSIISSSGLALAAILGTLSGYWIESHSVLSALYWHAILGGMLLLYAFFSVTPKSPSIKNPLL